MRLPSRAIRRFITARDTGTALTESGKYGAVEFSLFPWSNGIFLERRQLRVGAGVASHAMHFGDEISFIAWCEADALKFSYPLVYSSLKRRGCALLALTPPSAVAG
jgi:hypothetical protein